MAIADLSTYKSLVASGQKFFVPKQLSVSPAVSSGSLMSQWQAAPDGGAAATSTTYTNATTGAVGQDDPVGNYYLVSAQWAMPDNTTTGPGGALVLLDRLVSVGGLDGTLTSAQTVNTPTLPRYTTGAGVWAMAEVYSSVGSTSTNLTISYTNQAGTAGRTSKSATLWPNGNLNNTKFIPLLPGDTGFRSVQTATLSSGTGIAGNWGITLFRPIAFLPLVSPSENYERTVLNGGIGGGLQPIVAGACLSFVSRIRNSTNAQANSITLNLADA